MEITSVYQKIEQYLAEHAAEIKAIGERVWEMPELGYREEKTSALVRETLSDLGVEYTYPHALTGVKARLKGRESRYNVCVIGEMDAIKCDGRAAHACGHHAQIAALLGTATVLKKSGIMEALCGDVTLMAVPAEEFIELAYRNGLRQDGRIQYFGGKQQLIAEGAFDDVDIAMMLHAEGDEPNGRLYVKGHNLGFVAKTVTYRGRAVHGSTPFDGVNALNAAALSILGVHANRETFREEEMIRIHPIITKGGDVVNSVPDEVVVETYVRGATVEAIRKGVSALERAVDGACRMVGADHTIETVSGYLPLAESAELSDVLAEVGERVLGAENVVRGEMITGSTDIGDLSHLIPTVQPSIGGFVGALHSRDFKTVNPDVAYVKAVEILAKTVAELLCDHAKKAERVKNCFVPKMTKAEYIDYLSGKEE